MSEYGVDQPFEQRIARDLRHFADEGVRPFDAVEITRVAISRRGRSPKVGWPAMPGWWRQALLLALLTASLLGVGIAGGFIKLPTNELLPNPTFQPFSPLPFSPQPSAGVAIPSGPGSSLGTGSFPATVVPGTDEPAVSPSLGPPLTPAPTPTGEPTASVEPNPTPGPTISPTPTASATPTASPVPVAAVDAGDLHSCALTLDGRVFCWGVNEFGELGDGTETDRFSPDVAVVGIDDAISASAGIRFSCAVRVDRTVWCWGEDPGSDGYMVVPVQVPEIDDATAVTAGGAFACALRAGGAIACWGNGQIGQLGNGVFENNSGVPSPQHVRGIDNAVQVSSGWNHTCAVLEDGTIWCWGGNGDGATGYGQLGDGTLENRPAPTQVLGINDAVAVAAGGWSTCAIRSDRSVWCWGHGERGTLGDGNASNSATPVEVSGIDQARAVAVGRWHACVTRSDSSLWCWGDISWGGAPGGDQATPVAGRVLLDAVGLSTERSLLVIDRDRRLWSWGFGSSDVPEPVPVGP